MLKYDKRYEELPLNRVPQEIVTWYGDATANGIVGRDHLIYVIFLHGVHVWYWSDGRWSKSNMKLSSDDKKLLRDSIKAGETYA